MQSMYWETNHQHREQADELKKLKRLNGNIMRMLIQSINTVKSRPDWKR